MFKKLCIVIPVYNYSLLFNRCIQSAININMSKDEYDIIIVDDCSDEYFSNLYKSYENDNIKYIKINQRSGPGIARIEGLKHSEAKYCCFLDADDFVDSNYYIELINALEENDEYDFAIGGIAHYNDATKIEKIFSNPHENKILPKKWMISYFCKDAGSASLWNKVYKKKLFDDFAPKRGRYSFEELSFLFHIKDLMNKGVFVHTNTFYHYTIQEDYDAKYPYAPIEALKEIESFLWREDVHLKAREFLVDIIRSKKLQNKRYKAKNGVIPEC